MMPSSDLRKHWMALPPERREILTKRSDWRITARPDQLTPEGDWLTWLILAGRGWGKTRTGAEDAAWYAVKHDGVRVAVVAPTYADARDTCIEGESGLLSVLPASYIKAWNRSLGELILVNDSRFKLFSADEPERLRGPQHHRAWADELAAWKYPAAWDQLQFGLRLGDDPRVVVTTTPKPTPLVRQLVKSASTRITRGSTFDNAKHLAPAALAQLRERYEGTRLGRQELYAEILDDVPGALWTLDCIDAVRIGKAPEFQRVVVAVDPSGTTGDDDGDAIGIIVAGKGIDGRAYIIADRTCSLSPAGWGRQVVQAYHEFNADRIVAEKNFGGAMVEAVIRTADPKAPVRMVNASRGKIARAEPVAALYEQGRVSHVGQFDKLEDEMIGFTSDGYVGEGSPDRADALVWALTDLMLGRTGDFEWYVGT